MCDMGYIFIAGANFIKCADVVINIKTMFNTNSQVTVVSYMCCYISISLNLISSELM